MEIMGLNIGLPEAYLLTILSYGALSAAFNHGEKTKVTLFRILHTLFIFPTVLALGGWFTTLGLPQIIWLCIYALSIALLGISLVLGILFEESKVNAPAQILATFAALGLYYWGGLFA